MSCEGVTAYPDRIEEVVRTSIQAMKNKEGLFAFVDPQPEKPFIELAKTRGPEFALNATFLISTMVIGSKTEPFFRRISVPERFEKFSWLFKPNEAVRRTDEQITNACYEYFIPAGRQAEPIPQWPYNCRKLANDYSGSVREYFRKRDYDALRIYKDIVKWPRARTKDKEITRLGPKLTKLMIQWVRDYNLCELTNSDEVGVPVDFQLTRVMIQTRGLILDEPKNCHQLVQNVLPDEFDRLSRKGYRPEDISKSLWTIGSGGCSYKKHDECPVKDLCTRLISSKIYDREGKFDPKSVGRYKWSSLRPSLNHK
jgi:hypothetical protein